MFNLVRKVVAGPKNTTQFQGGQLDLTYITNRVIGMAFPASQVLEKAYRNPIEDVVSYFRTRHGQKYLIINVSSRVYDYNLFDRRVKDYHWPDHQSPPLTTLVTIAYEIYRYLKEDAQRVVAVHCNHGKGRTGTTIIAFLLLIGYSTSANDCLKFYNSKRFNKQTYGVDQPCQKRYLHYIERLMKSKQIPQKLICYRLKGITHKGLNCDYFVKISFTRNESTLFERVDFGLNVHEPVILIADILIEIYLNSWTAPKKIARINTNLYFCDQSLVVTFLGKDIKLSENHHSDFSITLHLQYFCLCHLSAYKETLCKCSYDRTIEEKYWQDMMKSVKELRGLTQKERDRLVNGTDQRARGKNKSRERVRDREKAEFYGRSMSSRKVEIDKNFKMKKRVSKTPTKAILTPPSSNSVLFLPSSHQKRLKLSEQIEYYSDSYPTIKISKVQKIQ